MDKSHDKTFSEWLDEFESLVTITDEQREAIWDEAAPDSIMGEGTALSLIMEGLREAKAMGAR